MQWLPRGRWPSGRVRRPLPLLAVSNPLRYNRGHAMGQSEHPRLRLAVAVAALLAMAAIVLLPTVVPLGTSQSPLPSPAGSTASPDESVSALSPLAKIGLTLLWIALGVGIGTGVILLTIAWYRRSAQ